MRGGHYDGQELCRRFYTKLFSFRRNSSMKNIFPSWNLAYHAIRKTRENIFRLNSNREKELLSHEHPFHAVHIEPSSNAYSRLEVKYFETQGLAEREVTRFFHGTLVHKTMLYAHSATVFLKSAWWRSQVNFLMSQRLDKQRKYFARATKHYKIWPVFAIFLLLCERPSFSFGWGYICKRG